jgi:hypothetical protein
MMDSRNNEFKSSKGGRPTKEVKRNQLLGVKCTTQEKETIERKAKEVALSVSEYLREGGLSSSATVRKQKPLPKEVLLFTATLNHLAANINQIAYKRNRGDSFTPGDKVVLFGLVVEIKSLSASIKSYLK